MSDHVDPKQNFAARGSKCPALFNFLVSICSAGIILFSREPDLTNPVEVDSIKSDNIQDYLGKRVRDSNGATELLQGGGWRGQTNLASFWPGREHKMV